MITREMKKVLIRMYVQSKTEKEMAKIAKKSVIDLRQFFQDNRFPDWKHRYLRILIVLAYSRNMTLGDMSEKTGVKESALGAAKRKAGIATKRFMIHNKRITDDLELEMVSMYCSGSSAHEVAKYYGYATSKTVLDVLKKQGVTARDQHYRDYKYDYLKKIDCHDKAYILGLIYTDGWIYKDYKGICVQLTETDGYLLENVAKRFGAAASVIRIKCEAKRNKLPNAKDMVRLGVYSEELAQQAKKLGVVKNKTYCLRLTDKLPQEYIYSFLRGLIDGDGTIGVYRGHIACRIAMKHKPFAEDVASLTVAEKWSIYTTKSNDMHAVSLLGDRQNRIEFLRKIYEHKSDLFLERKYAKVQSHLS
jgi:hypothetical protein